MVPSIATPKAHVAKSCGTPTARDLAVLEAESPTRAGDPGLIDELPVIGVDGRAPTDVFETFRLQVRHDKPELDATVWITIADEGLDHLDTTVDPLFVDWAPQPERRPRCRATVSRALGAL